MGDFTSDPITDQSATIAAQRRRIAQLETQTGALEALCRASAKMHGQERRRVEIAEEKLAEVKRLITPLVEYVSHCESCGNGVSIGNGVYLDSRLTVGTLRTLARWYRKQR